METPETKNASPEARSVAPAYEFKADGTCVLSAGPTEQTVPFRITKDGKVVIDKGAPQTVHELTAKRLVLGDGADKKVFTR